MSSPAMSATDRIERLRFGKVVTEHPVPPWMGRVPPHGQSLATTTTHGPLSSLRATAAPFQPGEFSSSAVEMKRPRQSNSTLRVPEDAEIRLRARVGVQSVEIQQLKATIGWLHHERMGIGQMVNRTYELQRATKVVLGEWESQVGSKVIEFKEANDLRRKDLWNERNMAVDMLAITNVIFDKKIDSISKELAIKDEALQGIDLLKAQLEKANVRLAERKVEVTKLHAAYKKSGEKVVGLEKQIQDLHQGLIDLAQTAKFVEELHAVLMVNLLARAGEDPKALDDIRDVFAMSQGQVAELQANVEAVPSERTAFVRDRLKGVVKLSAF